MRTLIRAVGTALGSVLVFICIKVYIRQF